MSKGGINISNRETVKYNMTIEDISLETAAQMKVGDTVYNSSNGSSLGVIKDYKVTEYEEDFFDKETGEYKKVIKNEFYTVNLVIETEAENKNGIYCIDDLKLNVGTGVYIRGKNYVCQGKIMGIAEVQENEK